jgi:hypothetical protein
MLHRSPKKSRKTTTKPKTTKHILQELQTLGRFNDCSLQSGNVLTVKKLLRHKRIENTMKYIHMIEFKDDEFDVAAATTVEEVKQLASAGFEKFDEINGIHVFRRPKRFQRL